MFTEICENSTPCLTIEVLKQVLVFSLLQVTPGSLRLAAVYGAALALTVIVLGAPVGRWVDRTSRLRAAQLSLSVQNLMVCLCAALLVLITSAPHLFTAWEGWALVLAEVSLYIPGTLTM